MRDRLIAAAVLIALLIVSWVIVANVECQAGQKLGSKFIIFGC